MAQLKKKTICRLLVLTLVLWLSVSAQPGSWANCVTAPAAPDQATMKYLYPAQASPAASRSGSNHCHKPSSEVDVLAPAFRCATHAPLRGSMPCCSHAEPAANSPRSAPERVISENADGQTRAPGEVSSVGSPALHVHPAQRSEIYLLHCVFLI